MPPVFFRPPLPVNHKAPKGRIVPLTKPDIRLGKCLVTLTPRRIKAEALEKVRLALRRVLKKRCERIVDVHATYPITKKAEGVKMGRGKGRIDHYVARVPAGYPIIRLPQLSPFLPGERPIFIALERVVANLPIACSFRSQNNHFKVDDPRKATADKLERDLEKKRKFLRERFSTNMRT